MLNEWNGIPMQFSEKECSYSPMFSSYGLCADHAYPGIRELILHYNRVTRSLWKSFIRLPGEQVVFNGHFDRIAMKTDCAEAELIFYERDAFVLSVKTEKPIQFFECADSALVDVWADSQESHELILRGYSENRDGRDPDPKVPIMVGLHVKKGQLVFDGNVCTVKPDSERQIYIAFAAEVLEISADSLRKRIDAAPETMEVALENMHNWMKSCVGDKLCAPADKREKEVFYRALSVLLMNLTHGPGYLDKYISAYPNRGTYPTHFLWDSAFQNLALEKMNMELARNSILQLTENIRVDGKIVQFQCSTWGRPDHVQPPLVGWMAVRYLDAVDNLDVDFMNKVFPALEANNDWWLHNRMTRFGLLLCEHGLETGQDDSPRFDAGSILAVDMNSYLIQQMRCTAELARRMGKSDQGQKWEKKADELAALLVKFLYDPEQNLFFDADAGTGRRQTLVTESAFLPLWCGVDLPMETKSRMIRQWLLSEKTFFGEIPFPCIAYDQSCYVSGSWWRGPTWLPMAWFMLEILDLYEFQEERIVAIERLYDMLLKDGVLHELFDSKSGKGLGSPEQGWTAAIFLRLGLLGKEGCK